MNGRYLAFLALLVCCVFALAPAAAAEPPTNDVPLDLESGVPLLFIGGLQVFNLYWDSSWDDPVTTMASQRARSTRRQRR